MDWFIIKPFAYPAVFVSKEILLTPFLPHWRESSLGIPEWAGTDGGPGQSEPGRVRNMSGPATASPPRKPNP